jgi:hypothetical protein
MPGALSNPLSIAFVLLSSRDPDGPRFPNPCFLNSLGAFSPQGADRTDSMRDVPDVRLSVPNPVRVGEFLRKAELVSLEEPRIDVREPAIRMTESMPGLRFSVSHALMTCCGAAFGC